MHQQNYRKTRYNKGLVTLTDRDHRVLRWISEQQAARFDQVQYLLGQNAGRGALVDGEISASAARQVITRWRRARWIIQRKVFHEEPTWLWPTTHLLRLLELPYKACEPSFVRLVHIFAVNEVRLSIEDIWPQYQWISERRIRADFPHGKGASLPHIPDGKLITGHGKVTVEVELTPKHPSKLLAILEELASTFELVWYFATKETRPALEAVLAKLDPALAIHIHLYSYSLEEGTDTSEGWAFEDQDYP
jgi:hypothetical protein